MVVRFGPVDTYDPDKALITGSDDITSRKIIIAAGRVVERGALLGRITATGKYVLSLPSASDGSEKPAVILAEPTDASSVDRDTVAYFGGTFNERAIVYGTGHTAATVREVMRSQGFKLVMSVP